MSLMKTWQELSDDDRTQVIWGLVGILAATVIVLYAIAASRGQDVEYFKERLALMEQRMNYMDQKLDKLAQRQAEHRENLIEIQRVLEQYQRQLEEQHKQLELIRAPSRSRRAS